MSLVFSFFGVCMGLNYLVKKLNEAKIEERFIRMIHKASTTQSTQVTGPLIAVETSGAARLDTLRATRQPSPPGISLVFDREENKRRSDPYSLIKPIIPRLSMETINVKSQNERITSSVPLKRIESAHVVAKANTSRISTEKVFFKTNEYGNQAVRKTSSTAKNDSYVAKLITVKKNEYGHIKGLGTYSVSRKRSNTSESDSEIEGITPGENKPSIHNQDEIAIESVARTESERKTEEPKIDVTEKVLFQKNIYTSRIIHTKTSIVDITLEKQDVTDKESNEEIETGCSIKKSVESIISKITSNLKNKNEDPNIDKNVTDTLIAAKQSSSNTESGRKLTEICSAENKESSCNAAKESSSPAEIDHVGETFPLKKIESQNIKQSSSDSNSNREHVESENIVVKKTYFQSSDHVEKNILCKKVLSGDISDKETTSAHSHIELAEENIPVKKVELGYVVTNENVFVDSFERIRENVLLKNVDSEHFAVKETLSSHFKDDRVGENIPVENVESWHIPNKEESSTDLYNEPAEDKILVKKVESGHVATKDTTSVYFLERVEKNVEVKNAESGHIAAKETTSSHSNDCRVEENISVKRIESGHLAAKETSSLYLPKKELVCVKKSVNLIESRRVDCETPSSILHTNKAREYAAIKKTDCGRETKETVPLTRSNPIATTPGLDEEGATERTEAKASPFHIESSITLIKQGIKKQKAAPIATKNTRIDDNITESSNVKMSNAVKTKYSEELVLENKTVDIESNEDLKSTDDLEEEEEEEPNKSLTAKIKELLEDEDVVELELYKPCPSSKK